MVTRSNSDFESVEFFLSLQESEVAMPEFLIAIARRVSERVSSDRVIVAVLWTAAVSGLAYAGWGPAILWRRSELATPAVVIDATDEVADDVTEGATDEVADEVAEIVRAGNSFERQRERLREQYPIFSLEERLAYEHQRAETIFASIVRSVAPQSGYSSVEVAPDVEERLSKLEETIGTHWLESVHSEEDLAEGEVPLFGMLRMPYVFETLPVRQPELLTDEASYIHLDGYAAKVEATEEQLASRQEPQNFLEVNAAWNRGDTYLELHEQGRRQFLSPDRFGYVASRKVAAGFRPHSISQMIETGVRDLGQEWQIVRLDLVSLLKFDAPRVYVSDYLPDMNALGDVETRPLDDFEVSALPQLASQNDVIIKELNGEIRMLGSLRAAKQCLDCHDVDRGELLGAFSYRLCRTDGTDGVSVVALNE